MIPAVRDQGAAYHEAEHQGGEVHTDHVFTSFQSARRTRPCALKKKPLSNINTGNVKTGSVKTGKGKVGNINTGNVKTGSVKTGKGTGTAHVAGTGHKTLKLGKGWTQI